MIGNVIPPMTVLKCVKSKDFMKVAYVQITTRSASVTVRYFKSE